MPPAQVYKNAGNLGSVRWQHFGVIDGGHLQQFYIKRLEIFCLRFDSAAPHKAVIAILRKEVRAVNRVRDQTI